MIRTLRSYLRVLEDRCFTTRNVERILFTHLFLYYFRCPYFLSQKLSSAVRKLKKKERKDILHTHTPPQPIALAAQHMILSSHKLTFYFSCSFLISNTLKITNKKVTKAEKWRPRPEHLLKQSFLRGKTFPLSLALFVFRPFTFDSKIDVYLHYKVDCLLIVNL